METPHRKGRAMFTQLTKTLWVSPQISPEAVEQAAAMGIALIINNRPDGESDDQPAGAEIAAAAAAKGIAYTAIPVTHAGFSAPQVAAMRAALDAATGPVLAYCRSGTRSTLLWALARAEAGEAPETLATTAAQAGYDVAPVRAMMDMLARKTGA